MGFNVVAIYFASGVALAAIFYLLRCAIDRRKGAMVEVAAVAFPIAVAACILKVLLPNLATSAFGSLLSLVIQAVFLALPVFVIVRLVERRHLGEPLQLADLFRVTTVTSLVAFVFTSLAVSNQGLLLAVCLTTFISSEWAKESESRNSNLAVVFVAGFLALVGLSITYSVRLTAVESLGN